jgi:hypothetical protein
MSDIWDNFKDDGRGLDDSGTGDYGRICERCTFDQSVTSFRDIYQSDMFPLPDDFFPATVCDCGAVYGPTEVYDEDRRDVYEANQARLNAWLAKERASIASTS